MLDDEKVKIICLVGDFMGWGVTSCYGKVGCSIRNWNNGIYAVRIKYYL